MASAGTSARLPARRGKTLDGAGDLSALDKRLLDEFQHDVPVCARPYAAMARTLGCDEATVIERLARLQRHGYLSRVGPVFKPNCIGASTLAAMSVPPERLEQIAQVVNEYPQVNHNYEREHHFNLWFVVTAADEQAVAGILADIQRRTGIEVMNLPLVEAFHIDLGFPLWET